MRGTTRRTSSGMRIGTAPADAEQPLPLDRVAGGALDAGEHGLDLRPAVRLAQHGPDVGRRGVGEDLVVEPGRQQVRGRATAGARPPATPSCCSSPRLAEPVSPHMVLRGLRSVPRGVTPGRVSVPGSRTVNPADGADRRRAPSAGPREPEVRTSRRDRAGALRHRQRRQPAGRRRSSARIGSRSSSRSASRPVYGQVDLGLLMRVVDEANKHDFALAREQLFRDEWLLCVFEAYERTDRPVPARNAVSAAASP